MVQSSSRLIFGASQVARLPEADTKQLCKILQEHSVTEIDTARRYVDSEITNSRTIDVKDFTIHTKAASFHPLDLLIKVRNLR
jgi:hypothetical protein